MAFKATQLSPGEAYDEIKSTSRRIKELAAGAISELAGDVTAGQIIGYGYRMKDKRDRLNEILANVATADLIAYAEAQENSVGYDVVAEFNTLSANVDAVVTQIQTDFPRQANRWLLSHEWGADALVDRVFNTAATAAILTTITTLHTSID